MSENAYTAVLDSIDEECLQHHGILGMKWGIRRYQNPDGTLTALGKKHLDDGKTQAAIDKWNQKKSNAMAKGNQKFAKKNIDYLSNEEIDKFKNRIKARTSLDDLKQESRKITEEKLRSWSNMLNSVSNAGQSAVNIYNTFAKVNNSLFGGKMKLIKETEGAKEGIQEIQETFRDGLLETRTTKSKENGISTSKTENFSKPDANKDKTEFINTTYDEHGRKTNEVTQYTKDGIKRKDIKNYKYNDSPSDKTPKDPPGGGSGSNSNSGSSESVSKKANTPNVDSFMNKNPKTFASGESSTSTPNTTRFNSGNTKTFASGESSTPGPNTARFNNKNTKTFDSGKDSISNTNNVSVTNLKTFMSKNPKAFTSGERSGNGIDSSYVTEQTHEKIWGNKSSGKIPKKAQEAIEDVDDYTDELFKILNGMGRI